MPPKSITQPLVLRRIEESPSSRLVMSVRAIAALRLSGEGTDFSAALIFQRRVTGPIRTLNTPFVAS